MNENREDLPSFERLVSEMAGSLSGFLRRMLGNRADAEDVFQETLMRIAVALPGLERRTAFKSWAFRIASNAAIDHIRKHKRASLIEFSEEDRPTDAADDDYLVLDEMNTCVRDVIDGLPPIHRAAIVLFYLEGKSVLETAEILEISPGAAKVRIHRARARLKEALDNECALYSTPDGVTRCDRKQPDAPD